MFEGDYPIFNLLGSVAKCLLAGFRRCVRNVVRLTHTLRFASLLSTRVESAKNAPSERESSSSVSSWCFNDMHTRIPSLIPRNEMHSKNNSPSILAKQHSADFIDEKYGRWVSDVLTVDSDLLLLLSVVFLCVSLFIEVS